MIGCDGIFDKLSNKDIVHLIWQNIQTQDLEKTDSDNE